MSSTPAVPDKTNEDGESCKKDLDCQSGHCVNQVCCENGECCKTADDCMSDSSDMTSDSSNAAVCEDLATCQGTRGQVMCTKEYRCVVKEGGVDDDSACSKMMEANKCGRFKSVFCNGLRDQQPPKCPDTCTTDDDCDDVAHCKDGKCIDDLPAGGMCAADNECASTHCNHGVCCAGGDCCVTADDCDMVTYSGPPTCDDPTKCQGSRPGPGCVDNQCTKTMIDDDSACDRNVVASDCGGNPAKCRGGVDQSGAPPCATGMCGGLFTAATCNKEAFCWQGKCVPDQPDGESCPNDDSSCQSGHCKNAVCCEEGDCCTSDDQCPSIKKCTDAGNCQGTRQDRHCDVDHGTCVNTGKAAEDDSGCAGQVAATPCGLNLPALCSAGEVQMQPPVTSCVPCTNVAICALPCTPTGPNTCFDPGVPVWSFVNGVQEITGSMPAGCGIALGTRPVGCLPAATTCGPPTCR